MNQTHQRRKRGSKQKLPDFLIIFLRIPRACFVGRGVPFVFYGLSGDEIVMLPGN